MTNIEETLIYVILSLHNQNQTITLDALLTPLTMLDYATDNLDIEIGGLIAKGLLISHKTNEYSLTELGKHEASQIYKIRTREEFSGVIERGSNSEAYLDFCGEVYGYRMPLFNMMDKTQLDFVFESIPVSSGDTVLDLGCGTGCILDHLVKKYACNGIGIDHIDPQKAAKSGLIKYIQSDIDDLRGNTINANICLAIDSLYFSANLEALISKLNSISDNRMYLFYSQYIFDLKNKQQSSLHADHTRLASALQYNGIRYYTIDFSGNEYSLYEIGLTVLAKYRASFEAESNISLYEAKLSEYQTGRDLYDQGLASRFLYIVAPE